MSWVKLDDGFHRNDKQMRMSDGAFRLYVCALSYCAQERDPTGYLSEEQAQGLRRSLGKNRRTVQELLELNAWEPVNGGYLIHDYDRYVEKGSRERMAKLRSRRRHGDVTGNEGGDVTCDDPSFPPFSPPNNPPYIPHISLPDPVPEPVPSSDVTVTDGGWTDNGLTRIDRASLGTLLEKARANRESASAQESQQA